MKKSVLFSLCISLSIVLHAQQKPLFDVSGKYSAEGQKAFDEIRQLILDNYYYDGISENDLYWAAVNGMLRHISPPEKPDLAKLWTDEEYDKIVNSLRGIQVTMGFKSSFNENDGSLTVTGITEESEAAGKLKLNDRILRIDGEPLSGKTLKEVNELIDGGPGQSSTLKVVRDITVFDVTLTRDTLKTENLIVTNLPNREVALIEMKKVTTGMAVELEDELNKLKAAGTQSIVLDLRNNFGGVLNEGINIARLFMKEGDIVLRTQARSNGISNFAAKADKFHDITIILLINENTASAAEIVAGALQDHKRAVLVGKKTYGKGVVETTHTLANKYRVKFITRAMYSPAGKSWQSRGLLPDYFIDQTQANYKRISNMNIEDRLKSDLHLRTALKIMDGN